MKECINLHRSFTSPGRRGPVIHLLYRLINNDLCMARPAPLRVLRSEASRSTLSQPQGAAGSGVGQRGKRECRTASHTEPVPRPRRHSADRAAPRSSRLLPPHLREGSGRKYFLRLAVRGRERLGFVHARAPTMHLCGYAFPFTHALPPHPLQRLGERRAVGARRLLPRDELSDGEVRLLLAGARPAEGHAPDLRNRQIGAGALCVAPHLAKPLYRRPRQGSPLPKECQHIGPPFESS